MAGLAKEFEQLGCWESATEEENIVIYGLDFEDEKVFIVFTDDMGKTPVDAKASLVAACYSEDDCFYWGKELENFAAWQHMCNEYKPGSSALLHALEVYELPKNKTK